MTQLNSTFISGNIFTCGSDYGQVGPSGINEITNRINTHTHDGSDTPSLMTYGSGIQSPVGYALNDVDNMTEISGTAFTIVTTGKPIFATSDFNFSGTQLENINAQIFYSGTTAGTGSSVLRQFETDSSDPALNVPISVSMLATIPAGSVIFNVQARQPGLSSDAYMHGTTLVAFELA